MIFPHVAQAQANEIELGAEVLKKGADAATALSDTIGADQQQTVA
jgi:hypothetical protein